MNNFSEKKYTDVLDVDDWEVETPFGWSPISHIMKSIPYKVWKVKLENGLFIDCADRHILIDNDLNEVFVMHCKVGDLVITKEGVSPIVSIEETEQEEQMFDLDIKDTSHVFWTNEILSHNCVLPGTRITILEGEEEKEITIGELYDQFLEQSND